MSVNVQGRRFSERTIQQVRLDCNRALARSQFCPDRSELFHMRCVDKHDESDAQYGNQLWYFDAVGVDHLDARHDVCGVVEYSMQFGLLEIIEDGVFDSDSQRQRFRDLYDQEQRPVHWRHPIHQWLLAGLVMAATILLAYLFVRSLTA